MNSDSEPSFRVPSGRRKQWLKVAGYVALVLLVAWLYSRPPDSEGPAEQSRPNQPTSSAGERPSDGRHPTSDSRPTQSPAHTGPSEDRAGKRPPSSASESVEVRDGELIARNVRVTNEDGRLIYRGDVDVRPTLERIDRGTRLRFSHDGIVFENREKRLPTEPSGYYHEFVHPTTGESGPGGQRLVLGQGGKAYYSPDHYHTFAASANNDESLCYVVRVRG